MSLFKKAREVKLLIMGQGKSETVARNLIKDNIDLVESGVKKGIDPRDIARNLGTHHNMELVK